MDKEEITYLSVEDITPYDKNARLHGSDLEFLKNSIRNYGFRNPILVDEYLTIIAGHGRLQAAIELGIEEVPCIICEGLTPQQVDALRLVDNQTSDMSSWNLDLLDEQLKELAEMDWFNPEDYGFVVPDFGEDEDLPAEEPEAPQTAPEAPSEAEPIFNLLVFCKTQEEKDGVQAYLLAKGLEWRELTDN